MRRTKTSNHGRFSKKQKKASRSMMAARKGFRFDRNATDHTAEVIKGAGMLASLLPFLFSRRGRG